MGKVTKGNQIYWPVYTLTLAKTNNETQGFFYNPGLKTTQWQTKFKMFFFCIKFICLNLFKQQADKI